MRWLLIAAILTVVIGYGAMSALVAMRATDPAPRALWVSASSIGTDFISVSFPSRKDKITLRGWLVYGDRAAGHSAILVPGYGQNRSALAPLAHDLVAHGYSTLLFDTRGTGQSGGKHQTLGNQEQRDVLGAFDYMRIHGFAPEKMTVFGESTGAAAVIEASPQLDGVAALISADSYSSLSPLLAAQFTKSTKLPGWLDQGGVNAARIFGVDPDLDPADVVRNLPQRAFLFIHLNGQSQIPLSNAQELMNASANPKSKLLIVGSDAVESVTAAAGADLYGFINSQLTG